MAETANVMEPHLAASVARTATTPQSGQPARSTPDSRLSTRPIPVAVTELTRMSSTPRSASARVHQRPREQDIELFMSGSLFGFGCLTATNSRGPDPFPAAPRRSAEYPRDGAILRLRPHAQLRRPPLVDPPKRTPRVTKACQWGSTGFGMRCCPIVTHYRWHCRLPFCYRGFRSQAEHRFCFTGSHMFLLLLRIQSCQVSALADSARVVSLMTRDGTRSCDSTG